MDVAALIAFRYTFSVETVTHGRAAAKDLRRLGSRAGRIMKASDDYAGDQKAHANNVTQLVGSSAKRLRVVFEESDTGILVTKVGPRGSVYE